MVADKSKKSKIEEKVEEENLEQIDGELVLSIEKLQEIQDDLEKLTSAMPAEKLVERVLVEKLNKINEKASDEVLEVEQKYNEIRKPVYDKRNEVIQSIPDFWMTAFLSHPALGDLLSEKDQKIFKYLSSLEVEDAKDVKSGYSITFHFNSNPFFEDAKLTKTFTFLEEGTTKITATPIKWKEGKGLPNGVNHDDKKGNKRALLEESFFTWFADAQLKEGAGNEIHDEVADVIKEDLWPNPLAYFNNEADEEDFDGDDDGDEEEEEEDEDDDDEEEE